MPSQTWSTRPPTASSCCARSWPGRRSPRGSAQAPAPGTGRAAILSHVPHLDPVHEQSPDLDPDRPGAEPPTYDLSYRDAFWASRAYEDLCDRLALRALLPATGEQLLPLGAGFGRLTDEYAPSD